MQSDPPAHFCSIPPPHTLLPVTARRGSKDVSDLDLKSCAIIPGRETLIEITKKSIGLGLSVIGGADTPLVRFSYFAPLFPVLSLQKER